MRLLTALVALTIALAGCASNPSVEPLDKSGGSGDGAQATPADLSGFGVNGDPFLGNPNATVQVVSFEAPGCSNCRAYHFNSLPAIIEDYADTNLIGYHFLQYKVGYAYDITGGIAAECAHREGGTAAYVHIMDLIFADQKASRLQEYLDDTAAAFDLDAEVLAACFDGRDTEGEVNADINAGYESGAGWNPGFAVVSDDGVELVRGVQGPRAAIDRALA